MDVISFEAGEVKTKLMGNRIGFSVINADRATNGCLRDLGSHSLTYGAFLHELLMNIAPSFVIQMSINKVSAKVLQRYRAK